LVHTQPEVRNTVDMTVYRDTTVKMEDANVNADYVMGWQNGYLLHPKREEQRVNDAYDAGYEDGKAHNTQNFQGWAGK
jgi:hypothetical protein